MVKLTNMTFSPPTKGSRWNLCATQHPQTCTLSIPKPPNIHRFIGQIRGSGLARGPGSTVLVLSVGYLVLTVLYLVLTVLYLVLTVLYLPNSDLAEGLSSRGAERRERTPLGVHLWVELVRHYHFRWIHPLTAARAFRLQNFG